NVASVVDLFILLSLFVHRLILKQLGLWKAGTDKTDVAQDVTQQETSQSETPKLQ
ncbi:unnamed protein product, partial [Rotaria sp. Silwood1]